MHFGDIFTLIVPGLTTVANRLWLGSVVQRKGARLGGRLLLSRLVP